MDSGFLLQENKNLQFEMHLLQGWALRLWVHLLRGASPAPLPRLPTAQKPGAGTPTTPLGQAYGHGGPWERVDGPSGLL